MALPDWLVKLAPTVASALGGPLAGIAVSALGSALGMSDATKDKITDVLQSGQMTSDQVAAVKQAELTLKQHESDNGFKFAELEIRDRESARAMQIANKSLTPEILSWMIVVATVGLEGYVLTKGMPSEVPDIVAGRILGTLDMAFGTVLAFWLGSSRGSQVKDSALANAASK